MELYRTPENSNLKELHLGLLLAQQQKKSGRVSEGNILIQNAMSEIDEPWTQWSQGQ